MTERDKLREVIRNLHGCDSTYLRSEPVHEAYRGEVVWDGVVEVFTLHGHGEAKLAYAWSHESDEGGRKYIAVLGVDPIRNASDAVRVSVAAEARN